MKVMFLMCGGCLSGVCMVFLWCLCGVCVVSVWCLCGVMFACVVLCGFCCVLLLWGVLWCCLALVWCFKAAFKVKIYNETLNFHSQQQRLAT